MKKIHLFILLISLTLSSIMVEAADKSAGEIIDTSLQEELITQNLWFDDLDNANSKASQDLVKFWKKIHSKNSIRLQPLVDLMFDFEGNIVPKQNVNEIHVTHSNPIIITSLRYLKRNAKGRLLKRIHHLEDAWQRRYVELVCEIIKMVGDYELIKIAKRFKDDIDTGTIKLQDLSPIFRKTLRHSIIHSSGTDILEQHEGTPYYIVTGLYNASKRIFAVDFARSLDDTLITFVHEMVHAADPNLDTHRKIYKELYPEVIKILSHWSNSKDASKLIEQSVIKSTFYEGEMDNYLKLALKGMELKSKILSDNIKDKKLSTKDKQTLREWIRAGIGLTVENEYRAYGFSMIVYASLKHKFNYIITESPRYEKYLHRLISGDNVFAMDLAMISNPFPNARTAIFVSRFDKKLTKELTLIIDQLEFIYLEELEGFFKILNQKFSSSIEAYSNHDDDNILPIWARKGNYDLPSNPHTILTARLTTSWVIKFKKHFEIILQGLKNFNLPLISIRSGITDLHDLTLTDLKLIGLWYIDSPYQGPPTIGAIPLKEELKHLDVNSPEYKRQELAYLESLQEYFKLYEYDLSSIFSPREPRNIVEGKDIINNLIRIKLLSANQWLERYFRIWHANLAATNNFIKKLNTDQVADSLDLPEERIQRLKNELINGLRNSDSSFNELSQLRLIIRELSTLHNFAVGERWQPVANSFNQKIIGLMELLDILGSNNKDEQSNIEKLANKIDGLQAQLLSVVEDCEKKTKSSGWSKKKNKELILNKKVGPFRIEGHNPFYVTTVCYQQKLYAVRQPLDYNNHMTSQTYRDRRTKEEYVASKIFFGGQKMRLVPIEIEKKERKRLKKLSKR